MTDKELLQEALDALTYVGDKDIYSDTIDALRARLAQSEPQREWVGLTDDDFLGLTTQQIFAMKFAEAKLKEKNT